jgi:hypothetical protein
VVQSVQSAAAAASCQAGVELPTPARGAYYLALGAAVGAASGVLGIGAVGAVRVDFVLTHSLKATGFKPIPLKLNPGFKMCLSNATCAATARGR